MAATTNRTAGEGKTGLTLPWLEAMQRDAEAAGLPRFEAWCTALERRYTVMPLWYWDYANRCAAYAAHVKATHEWQRKQARINEGNKQFFKNIRGARGS